MKKLKSNLMPVTACLIVIACFIIFWGCGGSENESPYPVPPSSELSATLLYQNVIDPSKEKIIAPDGGFKLFIPANELSTTSYKLGVSRTNALALDEALVAKKIALPRGVLPASNVYTINIAPGVTNEPHTSGFKDGLPRLKMAGEIEFEPVPSLDFIAYNYLIAHAEATSKWQFTPIKSNDELKMAINTLNTLSANVSYCLVKSPKATPNSLAVMLTKFFVTASPSECLSAGADGKFESDMDIKIGVEYTGNPDFTMAKPILSFSSTNPFELSSTVRAETPSNGIYQAVYAVDSAPQIDNNFATFTLPLTLSGIQYDPLKHPDNLVVNANFTLGAMVYSAEPTSIGLKP